VRVAFSFVYFLYFPLSFGLLSLCNFLRAHHLVGRAWAGGGGWACNEPTRADRKTVRDARRHDLYRWHASMNKQKKKKLLFLLASIFPTGLSLRRF